MIVAGIDPGKTGALAISYPDGTVFLYDVPIIEVKGKKKPAWANWHSDWSSSLDFASPDLIVIEDVSSRPGQGVTSMFSFGRSLGFAHAIAAATGAPVHFVTPATWKGKLGLLNSSKGASREKAIGIYGAKIADRLARVKDDGRAEAALLAYYGRKYL